MKRYLKKIMLFLVLVTMLHGAYGAGAYMVNQNRYTSDQCAEFCKCDSPFSPDTYDVLWCDSIGSAALQPPDPGRYYGYLDYIWKTFGVSMILPELYCYRQCDHEERSACFHLAPVGPAWEGRPCGQNGECHVNREHLSDHYGFSLCIEGAGTLGGGTEVMVLADPDPADMETSDYVEGCYEHAIGMMMDGTTFDIYSIRDWYIYLCQPPDGMRNIPFSLEECTNPDHQFKYRGLYKCLGLPWPAEGDGGVNDPHNHFADPFTSEQYALLDEMRISDQYDPHYYLYCQGLLTDPFLPLFSLQDEGSIGVEHKVTWSSCEAEPALEPTPSPTVQPGGGIVPLQPPTDSSSGGGCSPTGGVITSPDLGLALFMGMLLLYALSR